MAGQCPNFNQRRDPDPDVVCATRGSYEGDDVHGRCHPDLTRTGVFDATRTVATEQAPTFQPSFSQPYNSSSNLPGNATFAPSNATQVTTGNQQTQISASVPRHSQGQPARGNPPVSPNQVTLFADEEQQFAENYMLIDKEEPPSLVEVSITDDLLCMHPSPGLRR